jgi:hypothetical protein
MDMYRDISKYPVTHGYAEMYIDVCLSRMSHDSWIRRDVHRCMEIHIDLSMDI